MGKLLSLLARDNNSDCCGPKSSYDIFLDFENAKPTINEQEVYDEIQKILIRSDIILEEIQCYKVSNQPSAKFPTSIKCPKNTIKYEFNRTDVSIRKEMKEFQRSLNKLH